jgi:hypothetical protein
MNDNTERTTSAEVDELQLGMLRDLYSKLPHWALEELAARLKAQACMSEADHQMYRVAQLLEKPDQVVDGSIAGRMAASRSKHLFQLAKFIEAVNLSLSLSVLHACACKDESVSAEVNPVSERGGTSND